MYAQSHAVHWIQKYDQEVGLHEDQRMHCYVERYKITATPMNSNKFTEFGTKSKNSDLEIKKA